MFWLVAINTFFIGIKLTKVGLRTHQKISICFSTSNSKCMVCNKDYFWIVTNSAILGTSWLCMQFPKKWEKMISDPREKCSIFKAAEKITQLFGKNEASMQNMVLWMNHSLAKVYNFCARVTGDIFGLGKSKELENGRLKNLYRFPNSEGGLFWL